MESSVDFFAIQQEFETFCLSAFNRKFGDVEFVDCVPTPAPRFQTNDEINAEIHLMTLWCSLALECNTKTVNANTVTAYQAMIQRLLQKNRNERKSRFYKSLLNPEPPKRARNL
jgi:hypothetical protein